MRVTRYVIDASAAAEYLLRTSLGLEIADVIEAAILLAPELLARIIHKIAVSLCKPLF
jgi:hypothetical protein